MPQRDAEWMACEAEHQEDLSDRARYEAQVENGVEPEEEELLDAPLPTGDPWPNAPF
jgi:hypothetical protein